MAKGVSLKVKLVGLFALTVALVAALSFLNVQSINQTREAFTHAVENYIPQLTKLHDLRLGAAEIDKDIALYGAADPAAQKQNLQAAFAAFTATEQELTKLVAEDTSAADKTDFAPITSAKDHTATVANELIALHDQRASRSAIAAKQAEATAAEDALEDAITVIIDRRVADIAQENNQINARVDQVVITSIVTAGTTIIFTVAIGLAITISLTRKINKLKSGAAKLSSGDFSSHIDIKSQDELGQLAASFNKMSVSLRASYLRLALEKERDETLLESMSEGLIAVDEGGAMVLINSVAQHMLNLEGEVKGTSFAHKVPLLNEEGNPVPPAALPTKTLQTGETTNTVFQFKNGTARKLLINIAASPVKLEGRIAGAIFVLRDVTKEKEVDRMKTEFISLASHQLRTPLSAIKWFSEMLLNGDAGELKLEQADFAKNISDSADRMVDLVNSLLNISRIESGRIIVDPKPTDLKELITGIVNDLKAKTEERQQTLIISVHSDLPKIDLDPRLIGQVYLNLLTNAIKYTPKKGEISVLVSKKGDDVISQVTDNGYGIPKEQQGRIFQKFFRAENVAKVETDGTGLGLYLIKAIVESSGGKIWFESEENKGATFWFTIPLTGMKAKEGEVTLDA